MSAPSALRPDLPRSSASGAKDRPKMSDDHRISPGKLTVGRSEAIELANQDEGGALYDVYFATNRLALRSDGRIVGFGAERSSEVQLGWCEVAVPRSHKIGSIGSPLWKRLLAGDDRLHLNKVVELYEKLFWQQIKGVVMDVRMAVAAFVFILRRQRWV